MHTCRTSGANGRSEAQNSHALPAVRGAGGVRSPRVSVQKERAPSGVRGAGKQLPCSPYSPPLAAPMESCLWCHVQASGISLVTTTNRRAARTFGASISRNVNKECPTVNRALTARDPNRRHGRPLAGGTVHTLANPDYSACVYLIYSCGPRRLLMERLPQELAGTVSNRLPALVSARRRRRCQPCCSSVAAAPRPQRVRKHRLCGARRGPSRHRSTACLRQCHRHGSPRRRERSPLEQSASLASATPACPSGAPPRDPAATRGLPERRSAARPPLSSARAAPSRPSGWARPSRPPSLP